MAEIEMVDSEEKILDLAELLSEVDSRFLYRMDGFDVIDYLLSIDGPCHFLAYQSDEIVGSLVGKINQTKDSKSYSVQSIYVKPDFQKNGIAKQLLGEFIENAKSNLAHKVFATKVHEKNYSSQMLFKKTGFDIVRRENNYYPCMLIKKS